MDILPEFMSLWCDWKECFTSEQINACISAGFTCFQDVDSHGDSYVMLATREPITIEHANWLYDRRNGEKEYSDGKCLVSGTYSYSIRKDILSL